MKKIKKKPYDSEAEAKIRFESLGTSYLIDCEYHCNPRIKKIKEHKYEIDKKFSFTSDLPDNIHLIFDNKVIKQIGAKYER